MLIEICIGSSCHLKGSHDMIELFEKAIADNNLQNDVVLAGSFCMGCCSQEGVSVKIDDGEIFGVTKENFNDFFKTKVLDAV